VHVYEKSAKPGAGCWSNGIPDFKMEKAIIDRRVKQMEAEGVVFHCGVHVGKDVAAARAGDPRTTRRAAGGAARSTRRFLRQVAGPRPRRHPLRHGVPAAAETGAFGGPKPQRDEPQITAKDKHVIVNRRPATTGSDLHRHLVPPGAQSR